MHPFPNNFDRIREKIAEDEELEAAERKNKIPPPVFYEKPEVKPLEVAEKAEEPKESTKKRPPNFFRKSREEAMALAEKRKSETINIPLEPSLRPIAEAYKKAMERLGRKETVVAEPPQEKWENMRTAIGAVITRIDTIVPHLAQIDPSDFGNTKQLMQENREALQRIISHIEAQTTGSISAEDAKIWEDFQSGEGWLFERLDFLEDALDKMSAALNERRGLLPITDEERDQIERGIRPERFKDVPEFMLMALFQEQFSGRPKYIREKTEAPVDAAIPKPPREFGPGVKTRLEQIGITQEMLEAMPEFAEIADSEGKIEWMLDKLQQLKRHKIHQEAVTAFEEHHRKEGKTGSFRRRLFRDKYIRENEQKLAQGDFNVENYRGDIADLIHLADVLPDMKIVEIDGKPETIFNYVDVAGVSSDSLQLFNRAATNYANLPPENEWIKHSPKTRKGYEQTKKEYETEKGMMIEIIRTRFKETSRDGRGAGVEQYSEKDALQILNDAEFQVKMHQTLNNYPNAELELRDLAEAKGWRKHWDAAKAQLGIGVRAGATGAMAGGLGFGINAALLRTTVKSGLIMSGIAAAAPVVMATSALGLGGFIGWKRGGMNAEKELRREEELMRFAAEEKKESENKREHKGTDLNFVDAGRLTSKIAHLRTLIEMPYAEYLETDHATHRNGRAITFTEFTKRREGWIEQLEVRLEYTLQKLNEHKVAFGREHALSARYGLIREVSDATAELAFLPQQEEAFVTIHGKTRKTQLEAVLEQTEKKIEANRHQFIRDKQKKGAFTGILFAGLGYGIGQAITGRAFGSEVAHAVNEKAQIVRDVNVAEGKDVGKAFETVQKNVVSHNLTEQLLEQENPARPIMTFRSPEPQTFRQALESGALGPKTIPNVAPEIPTVKPVEITLTSEAQSRESALIKYFEGKGLDHTEAGKQAHETIKAMYPKGERVDGFVHKGDKILISEKDGKVSMKVISKKDALDSIPKAKVQETIVIKDHQMDDFTHRKIGVDSAERAITRTLRINAEAYGFTGDPHNIAAVKDWAHGMTQDVLKQNPELANAVTHDGDSLRLIRTTEGKWDGKVLRVGQALPPEITTPSSVPTVPPVPAPAPETVAPVVISEIPKVAEALEAYDVSEPTNLLSVGDKIFSEEPRYAAFNQENKDKFLFNFILHLLDKAEETADASAYLKNSLGISSGNMFDIQPGRIMLEVGLVKGEIDQIFKEVGEVEELNLAKNLSAHFGTFIEDMKGIDAADLRQNMFDALRRFSK